MSKREESLRLVDMLETAERVVRHMEGVDVPTFIADENLRDAVIFRLQIIGEAAYHISEEFKDRHPQVEWYKIQGLRHKIVHDYDTLDDETIHHIAVDYVPPLVEQLKKILESGL
jgi:uncharacterized protein with HEPN domain